MKAMTLAEMLDALSVEGELYEKLDKNKVRCYACGHRCLIFEGQRGICRVRYNDGGVLRVPHGYVSALQCDPTEKKPFFHVYPGSNTLTFGMLGCDYHCSYCFTSDVRVVTSKGVLSLKEVFALGESVQQTQDAEIAYPTDLKAIGATGTWRTIRAVFKHHYAGSLITIRPFYLPKLRCTPDHHVYATLDPNDSQPRPLKASELTTAHYLAIPKHFTFSRPQVVDVHAVLQPLKMTFQVPHEFDADTVEEIMSASAQGVTSRELGERFGKRADYIRHVRSKVRRGLWQSERVAGIALGNETVRFYKEKRPAIASTIPFTTSLARLLGYYCAEGSVIKSRGRPNSFTLTFTFAPTESDLITETQGLVAEVFGLDARVVKRETTHAVTVSKSSVALLFQSLCGAKANGKRVPPELFDAPRDVVESFLDAYVQGDGHRYPNGKVSVTTTSQDLAFGVAYLALKLGHLPSVYENSLSAEKKIEGRSVKQAERQFTVVWYTGGDVVQRRWRESENFYFVPIREIATKEFDGDVYNMEMAEEHNYLANFFLVKNCQNWVSSQALRDPAAGTPIQVVTPEELVALGKRMGARLVGSSYNEPLITAEWAVDIFKVAQREGLQGVYISNGNATREVLEYLKPYVVAYKVDLKAMSDKTYRQLGGKLDNVLNTIGMLHEMGFWVEIVTLIVPGLNDSDEEVRRAAEFLASISKDIPWHVTAFHKDYKMTEPDNTGPQHLIRAAEIGKAAGLRYVYAGNLPGMVGDLENTRCPNCHALLIERFGYTILDYRLAPEGSCPECGTLIPGLWPKSKAEVQLGSALDWWRRMPRPVIRYRSDVADKEHHP